MGDERSVMKENENTIILLRKIISLREALKRELRTAVPVIVLLVVLLIILL
jgi:hypothetical protein